MRLEKELEDDKKVLKAAKEKRKEQEEQIKGLERVGTHEIYVSLI